MIWIRKYIYSVLFSIAAFIVIGFNISLPERPNDGYWGMKGKLVTHQAVDKIDSLSSQEIYELQNDKGLTIWFCRDIHKQVCMTGQCKMIRLWLFWDGAGNYLGIQLPKNEPLTKLEHNKFEPADYEKLDIILRDTSSLLKDVKMEALADEVVTRDKHEIDAITGATKPTFSQAVVSGAVYTCYTLWHTVYGQSRVSIMDILDKRINQSYLSLLFKSENPSYISLAIRSVEKHPEYHAYYYPQIISFIKSTDVSLSKEALDYFEPDRLEDEVVQKRLVELIVSPQKEYEIIWKFTKLHKTSDDVVVTLLELYEKHELIVGTLNLIFYLIQNEHLSNPRILHLLNRLETTESVYNQNLIRRLLNKAKGIIPEH
jgi:hypothetical protein